MSKRYSNLLSWRFRLFILIRRRLIQWSVAWVAALLISVSWWQLRVHGLNAAEEQVALMETRHRPLQQMQRENDRIRKQLAEMNSHESLLAKLDDEQVPYKLLALVSLKVGEREGAIRLRSFKLTRKDIAPQQNSATKTKAQAVPETAEQTQVTIRGTAVDNLAVSSFVAALRDSEVFKSVDLKSSVGARVDNERAQTFIIVCDF